MSSITKYLLVVPSAYILYCIYEDHQYQAKKIALEKAQQSESIKSLTNRFTSCKSSFELANVFKKNFHYLRGSIVEPNRMREQVLDCEVLESGQGSSWWLYPYSTRSVMGLTPYLTVENKKQGYYSIFFWYRVFTKQSLRLKDTQSEVHAVKDMVKQREKKCVQIAKKFDQTGGYDFQDHFFDCIRRSEGAVRLIEKQLNRIQLIQEHERY